MKRVAASFLLGLLTVLVLLGSGGFTIGKMICGGNECSMESYSLGKAKDCCTSENETEELSSCCCELIDVSYSLDEFSVSEKVNVSAPSAPVFDVPASFSLHIPSSVFTVIFSDPSPPSVKDLLFSICSLRL